MAHEHYAGFAILAKRLEAAGLGVKTVVCKGWLTEKTSRP